MAIYDVVLYPFARQECEIDVPDEIPEDKIKYWITKNIKEKGKFKEAELDYYDTLDYDSLNINIVKRD